jgi:hypothetical protein
MQGSAKRSTNIMFTEAQLVSFGNFLFTSYDVQVYSNDGKNTPIYPRGVTDADISNWKHKEEIQSTQLPSQFQQGDKALFICMPDDPSFSSFPGIPCEVLAIHFYKGKVKYDLDLLFVGDQRSRIYNVDSVLVEPRR